MFYFMTIFLISTTALFAGPTQSKQTIYPIITNANNSYDSNASTSSVNNSFNSSVNNSSYSSLYFRITALEFDKNTYNTYTSRISAKIDISTLEEPTPLAKLTAIYVSRRYADHSTQYCIRTDRLNHIDLQEEEKKFINETITEIPYSSDMIYCRPIIRYTHQPKDKVRFMYLTCPKDLNSDK